MNGKFGYKKNCALIHHLPQGCVFDGCPVIIFPKEPAKVVEGSLYEFDWAMTKKATFVIDGLVYRVAHATNLRDTEGGASLLDTIVYRHGMQRSSQGGGTSLGDILGAAMMAKNIQANR